MPAAPRPLSSSLCAKRAAAGVPDVSRRLRQRADGSILVIRSSGRSQSWSLGIRVAPQPIDGHVLAGSWRRNRLAAFGFKPPAKNPRPAGVNRGPSISATVFYIERLLPSPRLRSASEPEKCASSDAVLRLQRPAWRLELQGAIGRLPRVACVGRYVAVKNQAIQCSSNELRIERDVGLEQF